ncbi:hypothetical protein NL676_009375 [Syzygium grande]|nr:hypothetical protein NL676_009375 [Syzygium grande]
MGIDDVGGHARRPRLWMVTWSAFSMWGGSGGGGGGGGTGGGWGWASLFPPTGRASKDPEVREYPKTGRNPWETGGTGGRDQAFATGSGKPIAVDASGNCVRFYPSPPRL